MALLALAAPEAQAATGRAKEEEEKSGERGNLSLEGVPELQPHTKYVNDCRWSRMVLLATASADRSSSGRVSVDVSGGGGGGGGGGSRRRRRGGAGVE